MCDLDPVLLWLWHRPAAAAPIGPLAKELAYAAGVALKKIVKFFQDNARCWSSLVAQWVKDLALSLLWVRTLALLWTGPKKKIGSSLRDRLKLWCTYKMEYMQLHKGMRTISILTLL